MNKIIIALLGIVALFAFLALMGVYYAFVLSVLWGWFVVPLGVAKIGMAHAYGLSLIPTTILGVRGLYAPEDKRTESVASALIMPAAALLFGWIALGFM